MIHFKKKDHRPKDYRSIFAVQTSNLGINCALSGTFNGENETSDWFSNGAVRGDRALANPASGAGAGITVKRIRPACASRPILCDLSQRQIEDSESVA